MPLTKSTGVRRLERRVPRTKSSGVDAFNIGGHALNLVGFTRRLPRSGIFPHTAFDEPHRQTIITM